MEKNNINLHIVDLNSPIDKKKTRCCGKKMYLKRITLPVVGLFALLKYYNLLNYIYLPIVVFLVSLSFFWNFPILILFANSKPFYYEDLFVDNSHIKLLDINPTIKRKFEIIFDSTLIVSNSLFVSALSDYWLYKIDAQESIFIIIGISGGILKFFQIFNQLSGFLLLHIIRYFIMKNIRKNIVIKNDNKLLSNKINSKTNKSYNGSNEINTNSIELTEITTNNNIKLDIHVSK